MVPFFHTLFTPFSHDFHTHSPSSVWWCKCESYTVINNGGGTDDDVDENDYSED